MNKTKSQSISAKNLHLSPVFIVKNISITIFFNKKLHVSPNRTNNLLKYSQAGTGWRFQKILEVFKYANSVIHT